MATNARIRRILELRIMAVYKTEIASAEFEDIEDLQLSAAYDRYNRQAFDGKLPLSTRVRWAKLTSSDGLFCVSGWLGNHDPNATPYLFLDQRLKFLYPRSGYLVDLILLHEMCHFLAHDHDAAFVAHLVRALERVSWEPLAARCVPVSLQELLRMQP